MMNSRFRRVAMNLTGNATYGIGQAAVLIILARTRGAEGVGIYAFALAIAAPIFEFTNLKLRVVLATDYRRDLENGRYIGLRVLTTFCATLIVTTIAFGFMPTQDAYMIAAICAYKAVESMVDILYGALQRDSQFTVIATSQIARTLLGTAGISVGLTVGLPVAVSVAIGALLTLPALAWVAYWLMRSSEPIRPDLSRLTEHFSTARSYTALGLSVAIGSLIANVPRYVLKVASGDAAVGVYSVLVYALVISGMLAQSFAETSLPRLSEYFSHCDGSSFKTEMRRLRIVGLLIGVAGVMLAALAGSWVLNLVLGPSFATHSVALVVLMGAAAVQYIGLFFGVGLTAMRQFSVEFAANVAGLIVVIAAAVALSSSGVIGAAIALLCGRLAITALDYMFYRRLLENSPIGAIL